MFLYYFNVLILKINKNYFIIFLNKKHFKVTQSQIYHVSFFLLICHLIYLFFINCFKGPVKPSHM